ncbi:helix-turn-helix transcriptional regulator [Roseinatronobacter bogoriensis]|uniref:Transcriptional regulator n=1 Tax=Roseinatronobacter bogoriensis subsp. barguzinensis TaxID=441209 RepID=A0A2K8KFI5_9RHOB|nr:transcriptional regulator [Rhodobaca]ATX65548.1 transcriptional regulator [Rhodobaca barguzinensis]MBB4209910.1 hypothetical protein [Rhodobaca bogoriensis DSM 18756]TDW32647.1 hypothetical protein LY39_03715 [Rhodobaca barguzinensis]TDY65670.1 hypothetical protein EV660_11817 [Rhodobaca bogoriensis DSM 18756]
MTDTEMTTRPSKPRLLSGWISRLDLALELGLTVETLHRWEKLRFGPPCVRAGRKIYYRRDAVQNWLLEQEQERNATVRHAAPRRAGGRR